MVDPRSAVDQWCLSATPQPQSPNQLIQTPVQVGTGVLILVHD
jgi:hypothetical protein